MKEKTHHLAIMLAACAISGVASGGALLPPQAIPPIEPQQRPLPHQQATSVVIEVAEAASDNKLQIEPGKTPVSQKTRNEIHAMLADQVQKVKNVVIIDRSPMTRPVRTTTNNDQLAIADQPNGHFRLFVEILPEQVKGKVVTKLQLLKAGHSGDAQNMAKPIAEEVVKIDPQNVRKSESDIYDFLEDELHMSDDGNAQTAMKRPNLSMWVEVKNADGSEGIKDGSKVVIYYKPDSNLYMNLYYVNAKNEIQRLVPGKLQMDNFIKQQQIYRFPASGEGLTISGKGTDKIRAIYTRMPSGAGIKLGLQGGLQAKQAPIAVIPTQYPAVFATADLGNFFSLPEQVYNEYEISFKIK